MEEEDATQARLVTITSRARFTLGAMALFEDSYKKMALADYRKPRMRKFCLLPYLNTESLKSNPSLLLGLLKSHVFWNPDE